MKFFYDTEFIEAGPDQPVRLISIGMVAEDNRTYYAECAETDLNLAGDWVKANVIPHLSGGAARKPRAQIAQELADFVAPDDNPRLWGYFSSYDHVVLCQIFGTMMNLPHKFPKMTSDIVQRMLVLGVRKSELPQQATIAHNALNDAFWTKESFEYLDAVEAKAALTPRT